MLRIMMPGAKPPMMAGGNDEQDLPEQAAPEAPSQDLPDDTQDEGQGSEKIDQKTVVYMTSDQGPFECDNCYFYQDPGSCKMVEGKIDPKGCCDIFTSMNEESSPDDEQAEGDEAQAPPQGE